jgi:hypothetical protein
LVCNPKKIFLGLRKLGGMASGFASDGIALIPTNERTIPIAKYFLKNRFLFIAFPPVEYYNNVPV